MRHLNETPKAKLEISPGKGSTKFDQSQGRINNLFENSRFSGTNSLNSHTLAQSNSQIFLKNKKAKTNFSKGHGVVPLFRPVPLKPEKTAKMTKASSMTKALASSHFSIKSNDIPGVEEVDDNELSTAEF